MKKLFYVFTISILFFVLISITSVTSAATLDTVTAQVSKEKISPGEEVKVTVSFGRDLGAYTINIDYDEEIFDYVSTAGGTANDDGDVVILTYHDTAGGANPRTNEVITFKAKENLTGSNPTDFLITLEGLANPNASERYDNIDTAIKKDVLVEPNYVNYSLKLNYTGEIEKSKEKDMKLITESTMGKNYDHVRLIAEVTKKPEEKATAKLLATQEDGVEIDLLQSGWGEADGYALGGKNVKQELALRGVFDTDGKYTVHIKLIDRDDSDKVIVEKSFDITVGKQTAQKPTTTEKLPAQYPTTGVTQYVFVILAVVALAIVYIALRNNKIAKHYKD